MELSAKIAPCLWFNDQAETAANLYTALFPDSHIGHIAYYSEVGREFHGHEPGSVLTVDFEISGQPFTALNGGPQFPFNEAVSFQVYCDDQAELDRYWNGLVEGGSEQPCGWLKDRFGISWQIVPRAMIRMMWSGDAARIDRMMAAMFTMKRLDIAELERAFRGA